MRLLILTVIGIIFSGFLTAPSATTLPHIGNDVDVIEAHVTVLTHQDGNTSKKTDVPPVDRRLIQSEIEELFSKDACVANIPVNASSSTPDSESIERTLRIQLNFAVQDSLDGVTCSYLEGCSYASLHFTVRKGDYSWSSHVPRLIVAKKSEVNKTLLKYAVGDTASLIKEIFYCKNNTSKTE